MGLDLFNHTLRFGKKKTREESTEGEEKKTRGGRERIFGKTRESRGRREGEGKQVNAES